jgi:hypothetical protein
MHAVNIHFRKFKHLKLQLYILGYLAGLFLCGMTSSQECVELLQQYLDITGDVQTVTWLAVKALPGDVALTNEAVQVNHSTNLIKFC